MSTTYMASAISNPTYLCQSSLIRKPIISILSNSVHSLSKTPNFSVPISNHQLSHTPFAQWHGLRHLGISSSQLSVRIGKKRKGKGKGVFASLFGVGAPEALVIGVVALLVFGPKGLAEVARTLGKTLRAFQPTIRELQDVSREFKSTLEREIGLDEIQNPMQNNYTSSTTTTKSSPSAIPSSEDSQMKVDPNGSPSTSNAYSTEDYLKITEEQLKAVATQEQIQTASLEEKQSESQSKSQDVSEAAAVVPPPPPEKPRSDT